MSTDVLWMLVIWIVAVLAWVLLGARPPREQWLLRVRCHAWVRRAYGFLLLALAAVSCAVLLSEAIRPGWLDPEGIHKVAFALTLLGAAATAWAFLRSWESIATAAGLRIWGRLVGWNQIEGVQWKEARLVIRTSGRRVLAHGRPGRVELSGYIWELPSSTVGDLVKLHQRYAWTPLPNPVLQRTPGQIPDHPSGGGAALRR